MNDYLSLKLRVISLILIIMIVFVHSYSLNFKISLPGSELKGFVYFIEYLFSQGLFRLATPIFFTISGYLFFLNMKGTWSEFISKIKKRFRTIVIPYLFWSTFGLLIYFILQLSPELRVFFIKRIVINYSLMEIFRAVFLDPVPGQLWFLRDLIVLIILSPIIYLLVKYFRFYVVIFFMFIWFYEFNIFIVSNRGLFFFTLGAFLSTKQILLKLNTISKRSVILIYLWVFIFLFKTLLIYFNYRDLIILDFIHKIGILVGIWAIWNYYDYLFNGGKLNTNLLNKLFPFTFFIYLLHEPMLTIIRQSLHYFLGREQIIIFVLYIGVPILVIYISVVLGNFTKQLTPKFYGLVTGNR